MPNNQTGEKASLAWYFVFINSDGTRKTSFADTTAVLVDGRDDTVIKSGLAVTALANLPGICRADTTTLDAGELALITAGADVLAQAVTTDTDVAVADRRQDGLRVVGQGGVDYLDVSIASRLADADYTAPPTVEEIRAEMDDNSIKLARPSPAIAWEQLFGPNTADVYAFCEFGDYLYAGTGSDADVYRSADGIDWDLVFSSGDVDVRSMAVFDGYLYVGTDVSIYRTNDGVNWAESFDQGPDTIYSLCVFGDYIYAGAGSSGVIYRSADGETWSIAYTVPDTLVYALAVFDGYLYAGTGTSVGKIYRTSNGTDWAVAYDSPNALVTSLAEFKGYLYAGCTNDGIVYRSANGVDWTSVLESETNSVVTMASYRDYLYIGSGGTFDIAYRTGNGTDWVQIAGPSTLAWVLYVFNDVLYAGTTNYDGQTGHVYRLWSVPELAAEIQTRATPTDVGDAQTAIIDALPDISALALEETAQAIQERTGNLPDDPAAVGSAMTLTEAYNAAKAAASQASVNALPSAATIAAEVWGTIITGAITASAALLAIYNKVIQFAFGTANRVDATVVDKTGFSLTAAYDRAKTAASAAEVAGIGVTIQSPGVETPTSGTALALLAANIYSWKCYQDAVVAGAVYKFQIRQATGGREVDGYDAATLTWAVSADEGHEGEYETTITLTAPSAGSYTSGVGYSVEGIYQKEIINWPITVTDPQGPRQDDFS